MKKRTSVITKPVTARAVGFCLAIVIFIGGVSGCSSVGSKFRSNKQLDMGPFAEDMIAVAGEIQYSLGQQKVLYLRDYADSPQLLRLRIEADRARRLVRAVIAYSIQMVTLGDSNKPDAEKAAALADYLDDVVPKDVGTQESAMTLTRTQIDTILTDVRSQQKFLDAIAAAQPLVDDVAIASSDIFDDLKKAMDETIDDTRRRIEDRYRDVRVADELLRQRQIQAVYSLAFLPQIRSGVPGAADSLLAREPSLTALADVRDGVDSEEMLRIEDRMLATLRALREIRDQLEPDIETYFEQQHELDELRNGWNAELRKARVAIVAWARAHKRMSQGVVDPADIDLLGIARKAAGSVMP